MHPVASQSHLFLIGVVPLILIINIGDISGILRDYDTVIGKGYVPVE